MYRYSVLESGSSKGGATAPPGMAVGSEHMVHLSITEDPTMAPLPRYFDTFHLFATSFWAKTHFIICEMSLWLIKQQLLLRTFKLEPHEIWKDRHC